MRTRISAAAACAALILLLAACSVLGPAAAPHPAAAPWGGVVAARHQPGPPRRIYVGIKTYQPGLDLFPSGANDPSGFEWTMIENILSRLGYLPVPVPVTSDDWEAMLDSGAVQMVLGSLSYTTGRASSYLLAGPYMTGQLALLTYTASGIRPHSTDEPLSGLKICYVRSLDPGEATTAQAYIGLARQTSAFGTTTATTTLGCLAKLRDGSADAFLSDAVILLGIHAQSPGNYSLYDQGGIGQEQSYVMAFPDRAAMSGLCRAIDSALPGFLENGWWSDFEANFDPRFSDKSQAEAEYQPSQQDIDRQWCSAG
jgi:glutamate transport system substrate-binding protein